MASSRRHLFVIVGTRPEAIKLAPVVREIQSRGRAIVTLCSTGQHAELLQQTFDWFGLVPDIDLAVMTPGQTLSGTFGRVVAGVDRELASRQPDVLVVQGDTTSVAAAALAAFHRSVPVAHVEAGLRTGNLADPFPEEANRRIVDALSAFCFAPTPLAADALLREGKPENSVWVTGNTAIDALLWTQGRCSDSWLPAGALGRRVVTLTMHRRESFGEPMRRVLRALVSVAETDDTLRFVFPVHPNPSVREIVREEVGSHPSFILTEPQSYERFVALMSASELIVTDSGGIQEEAPALGRPVVVVREATERTEAVLAGASILAGTTEAQVREAVLSGLNVRPRVVPDAARGVFGDGDASRRIVDVLLGESA